MMEGEQNGLTYINEPAHLFVNVLCPTRGLAGGIFDAIFGIVSWIPPWLTEEGNTTDDIGRIRTNLRPKAKSDVAPLVDLCNKVLASQRCLIVVFPFIRAR
jgi:hypothetical protein